MAQLIPYSKSALSNSHRQTTSMLRHRIESNTLPSREDVCAAFYKILSDLNSRRGSCIFGCVYELTPGRRCHNTVNQTDAQDFFSKIEDLRVDHLSDPEPRSECLLEFTDLGLCKRHHRKKNRCKTETVNRWIMTVAQELEEKFQAGDVAELLQISLGRTPCRITHPLPSPHYIQETARSPLLLKLADGSSTAGRPVPSGTRKNTQRHSDRLEGEQSSNLRTRKEINSTPNTSKETTNRPLSAQRLLATLPATPAKEPRPRLARDTAGRNPSAAGPRVDSAQPSPDTAPSRPVVATAERQHSASRRPPTFTLPVPPSRSPAAREPEQHIRQRKRDGDGEKEEEEEAIADIASWDNGSSAVAAPLVGTKETDVYQGSRLLGTSLQSQRQKQRGLPKDESESAGVERAFATAAGCRHDDSGSRLEIAQKFEMVYRVVHSDPGRSERSDLKTLGTEAEVKEEQKETQVDGTTWRQRPAGLWKLLLRTRAGLSGCNCLGGSYS